MIWGLLGNRRSRDKRPFFAQQTYKHAFQTKQYFCIPRWSQSQLREKKESDSTQIKSIWHFWLQVNLSEKNLKITLMEVNKPWRMKTWWNLFWLLFSPLDINVPEQFFRLSADFRQTVDMVNWFLDISWAEVF